MSLCGAKTLRWENEWKDIPSTPPLLLLPFRCNRELILLPGLCSFVSEWERSWNLWELLWFWEAIYWLLFSQRSLCLCFKWEERKVQCKWFLLWMFQQQKQPLYLQFMFEGFAFFFNSDRSHTDFFFFRFTPWRSLYLSCGSPAGFFFSNGQRIKERGA